MIVTAKVTLVKLNLENTYKDLEKDFHIRCDKFIASLRNLEDIEAIQYPQEYYNFKKLIGTDLEIFSNLNLTKVDFFAHLVKDPVLS